MTTINGNAPRPLTWGEIKTLRAHGHDLMAEAKDPMARMEAVAAMVADVGADYLADLPAFEVVGYATEIIRCTFPAVEIQEGNSLSAGGPAAPSA